MLYTLSGPLGNVKAASTAGGGTALTTAAATVMLPFKTRYMNLIPRNFTTAVVVKWTNIPWLTVLKSTDVLVTAANMTDYSNAAQDNSTGTTLALSSLATLANGGALYIGSSVPFIGATVDVQNTNSNASVLTVKYRKSDSTWADTSATDNTASGGATMAVDGTVTWSEPTDWIAQELGQITSGIDPSFGHIMRRQLFWTRWEVSAALDASVTLNSLVAIPRASYSEIPSGMAWQEACLVGRDGIAGISALTDAGTANLIVDVATADRANY